MDEQQARRQAIRAELAEMASALRQWAEYAEDTGAEALPFDESPRVPPMAGPRPDAASQGRGGGAGAPSQAPPAARRRAPGPRPPSSRPATRPPGARKAPSFPGGGSPELDALRAEMGDCRRCGLHQGRTNLVFGVGNPHADVVVVGEGPGYHEDRMGEPFVGRAGQLLTRMLAAVGVPREEAYICNVVKCRPPNNRDPNPDEIATCSPFMRRQIEAIDPKVVITVGRFAGNVVLGTDETMGRLRGAVREAGGVPVVPLYHPAYLLRNPAHKGRAWEDLLRVKALLREG
ncbi:MAG: uracil-DNA glycosylase [Myxococcota bacterium]